jgi:hypothetical protein
MIARQMITKAESVPMFPNSPDIKPDRLLDDFGREAVAAIADLGHHRRVTAEGH